MRSILAIALTLFVLSCKSERKQIDDLSNFAPHNSSIILSIANNEAFQRDLKNNDFLNMIEGLPETKDVVEKLTDITTLNPKSESLLCFVEVGKNNFEYSFITKSHPELVKSDTLANVTSFNYNNTPVKEKRYDGSGSQSFQTTLDSIFIQSSSRLIIENTIRTFHSASEVDHTFLKNALETFDPQKQNAIFIDDKKAAAVFKKSMPSFDKFLMGADFASWVNLEIGLDQNAIRLDGIAFANDSLPKILNILKNTNALENTSPKITPISADAVISFTYDDWETLSANLHLYDQRTYAQKREFDNDLFSSISEVSIIYDKNEKVAALRAYDIITTTEALGVKEQPASTFRDIEIFSTANKEVLNKNLYPLIEDTTVSFYAAIGDHLLFSNSQAALENIIANYQSNNTLAQSKSFKDLSIAMSDASSILMIGINPGFKELLADHMNEQSAEKLRDIDLRNYPMLAFQIVQEKGYAHVHGVIKRNRPQTNKNTVSQIASITLDADLGISPQFVMNHRTKEREIVIQDVENNLYLISNQGDVLWKKKLDGRIIGTISQVDLYRNGRLQLAFTTDRSFMVLDRNGKVVPPFDVKYDKKVTQPLAVFDYENNKDYRFVVTTGKRIWMYNRKREAVGGFTFKNAKNQPLFAPKHLRIKGKDYIVIAEEGGKLNILDRRGKTRVPVAEKIDFSDNEIYLYENTFMTTNKNGQLVQIDTNGKMSKRGLNLEEQHFVTSTSKTLVTLSENLLTIKGKKVELDYGIYTRPEVFYISNKIYVSTTDTQSKKVYLFDSNAKTIANFPIYGRGEIDLENIDKDQQLECVVKGERNSILLYQIN
ncbi:ribonuclease HII [Sungkyunkwania multivorans]|uniref:Ribonuclease HII n=1 Tax=Sungkyunkwania multivorans TaxID=1173618 RepID=A0ABW3CVS6_9FLAO